MQSEIDNATTSLDIQILGINRIGAEGDNGVNVAGRRIPWLQDTESEQAWETWNVTWRDVVILDAYNRPVALYNLTSNDLGESENYQTLRSMLESAAEER